MSQLPAYQLLLQLVTIQSVYEENSIVDGRVKNVIFFRKLQNVCYSSTFILSLCLDLFEER